MEGFAAPTLIRLIIGIADQPRIPNPQRFISRVGRFFATHLRSLSRLPRVGRALRARLRGGPCAPRAASAMPVMPRPALRRPRSGRPTADGACTRRRCARFSAVWTLALGPRAAPRCPTQLSHFSQPLATDAHAHSCRSRSTAAMQLDTLDRSNVHPIASSALAQMGHAGQSPSLVMVTIPPRPTLLRQASSGGSRQVRNTSRRMTPTARVEPGIHFHPRRRDPTWTARAARPLGWDHLRGSKNLPTHKMFLPLLRWGEGRTIRGAGILPGE